MNKYYIAAVLIYLTGFSVSYEILSMDYVFWAFGLFFMVFFASAIYMVLGSTKIQEEI